MASLRFRIIFGVFAVQALGAGGFALEACGGDDNADGGDSGPDVTQDVVGKDNSQPDVVIPDAGKDADASDAPTDGPPPGLLFAENEANAICTQWFKCCPSDAGYDTTACVNGLLGFGWESNLPQTTTVYGNGHVNYDTDAGAACIAAINSFTCTQTANYWASVTTACQHVFSGKLTTGQTGCVSSYECAPNNFCDPTVDGGQCELLKTSGQACNDKLKGYTVANQECSYLGSTQSGLFCDVVNNDGGYGGAATCKPTLSNTTSCCNATTSDYTDLACTSLLCGDNCQCGSTTTYPVIADSCNFYKIKDAGGGG